MGDLTSLLAMAGFSTEDCFSAYESVKDEKLPFGSLISLNERERAGELYHNTLKGINFYRRNAEEFRYSDFRVATNSIVSDYLREHESDCKILPKPVWKKESHGNLGEHTDFFENEYVSSAAYGTSDLIFKFVYYKSRQQFRFYLNLCAFNNSIDEQKFLHEKFRQDIDFDYDDEKRIFNWAVENLFVDSEFLPIEIDETITCRISHKAYRNKYGQLVDAVTAPTLGYNIKRNENVMANLEDWLNNGGYIKDWMTYLIHEDRETGAFYLRPYKDDFKVVKVN
jgi:hypothetical protein